MRDFLWEFYSSISWLLSLGQLLGTVSRAALLSSLGFMPGEVEIFSVQHTDGLPLLSQFLRQAGEPLAWQRAIADWHCRCWFEVSDGKRRCFTSTGGDPLADVAFCFSFSVFLSKVQRELAIIGCGLLLPVSAGGIFGPTELAPHGGHCRSLRFSPLAYMDDVVLLLEGASYCCGFGSTRNCGVRCCCRWQVFRLRGQLRS